MAGLKQAIFKFQPFSIKQLKVLTWWMPASPVHDMDGIIADGAIRSGKTLSMSLSFVIWAMETFENQNFGMCGKTIGSFRRNVVLLLKPMLKSRGYRVEDHRADNMLVVKKNGIVNLFYIFGGKDERSQDLIQGITFAGILFDEVVLMPESFVNQATGRCSVDGSKFWFNCNPAGPFHWFKANWIDKVVEKNLTYLHFTMDDNLSLTEKIKARYRAMYAGVFFKRYILGLWVAAEGLVYDMYDPDKNEYDELPLDLSIRRYRRYVAIDYGTTNPCVFLEIIDDLNGNYYVERERYYDSKAERRQKDDAEHADDLDAFVNHDSLRGIVIDPSAASFKIAIQKKGLRTTDADNEVLDGIRLVGTLLAQGRLHINRRNCPNTRKEFASYIWNEKRAENGVEEPVKQSDHAMDAIRYFIKTIVGGYRSVKKQ